MADNNDQLFFSRKQLQKHIQKLNLHDGDVLAVKAGTFTAKQEVVQGIAAALGRAGKKDIIVVVVDDFTDLSVLNEQEMNGLGWFRLPTLRKLIHTKDDAEPEKEVEDGSKEGRPDSA